jgi:hypothetical protein
VCASKVLSSPLEAALREPGMSTAEDCAEMADPLPIMHNHASEEQQLCQYGPLHL